MATEKECQEALDKHENQLSSLPNVVGLGVVAEDDSVDEPSADKLAVGVYVRQKLPKEALKRKEMVPAKLEIPKGKKKIKIKTRVIEQGEVTLEEPGIEKL